MSVLSNDSFIVFAKTCLQKGSGTSVLQRAKATKCACAREPSGQWGIYQDSTGEAALEKGRGHMPVIVAFLLAVSWKDAELISQTGLL